MKTKTKTIIGLGALALLTLTACDKRDSARREESSAAREQLGQFLESQPIPRFNYSQLRQNLIELETAQADTTATTSFMFLLAGAGETGPLVHSCPSIGFPIPATYQLTNPEQAISDGRTVPQLESTGVYTGETTGTYVICIGDDGQAFAFYHEGFVATVTGPAHWDNERGEIVMDGSSSAEFTESEDTTG
jgi:hypothetical protein